MSCYFEVLAEGVRGGEEKIIAFQFAVRHNSFLIKVGVRQAVRGIFVCVLQRNGIIFYNACFEKLYRGVGPGNPRGSLMIIGRLFI
ncbi:MAG: hypothetical protein CRN43_15990 [Candidatus Nephrothrix sp. EaCA]|nr:MAG: hypothetical protein CRN43_15990 [Candidatus Nephrothrix sp. EaCA]